MISDISRFEDVTESGETEDVITKEVSFELKLILDQ